MRKGPVVTWNLHLEPRDLWLGVYWDWKRRRRELHIFVCLVPMLPIHITVTEE